jgi:hypothetical protein
LAECEARLAAIREYANVLLETARLIAAKNENNET